MRHRLAEKGLGECLRFYEIAPLENAALLANAPYLPGFEKIFTRLWDSNVFVKFFGNFILLKHQSHVTETKTAKGISQFRFLQKAK